ncbi:flagellar biosynthetic protein FliO [Crenobacter sp. SG2303]|uniref:Flagellar protein n=1 Tax=Crenobacter oryzisoli TaxID=3056844 RepID=A0ABT7XK54_9NEIS|nr:flagellar biosynthetic protein FliO [Crenobacter sp. SG2303]MDN0074170.1 flagellar biosynthetic protein FliO [Crenobacter sp. SG2303]
MLRFALLASGLLLCGTVRAAVTAAPQLPSPVMGVVQVVLALVLVIGAVLALAWAVRRLQGGAFGITQHLKVVSAVMVGPRERVVIVEFSGDWLVLGVSGQQVTLLSREPRPADLPPTGGNEPPFARFLKSALAAGRRSSADSSDSGSSKK